MKKIIAISEELKIENEILNGKLKPIKDLEKFKNSMQKAVKKTKKKKPPISYRLPSISLYNVQIFPKY